MEDHGANPPRAHRQVLPFKHPQTRITVKYHTAIVAPASSAELQGFTLRQRDPRIASGQQPSWTHRLHAQIYGHEREMGRGRHEMENSKPTPLSIPLTSSYTPHSPLMYSAISKGWVCVSTYLYVYLSPSSQKTSRVQNAQEYRHKDVRVISIKLVAFALVNASFFWGGGG